MAYTFRAKRDGHCRKCSEPILTGQLINWSRRGEIRGARHAWHDDASLPHDTVTPTPPFTAVPAPNPFTSLEIVTPLQNTSQHSGYQNGQSSASTPVLSLAEIQRINNELAKLAATDARTMTLIESETRKLAEAIKAQITPVTTTIVVKNDVVIAQSDKRQHRLFSLLVKMVTMRQPVYLWGDAGSGKSSAAHEVSILLNLPYYYLGLQAQTVESKLMGYMDANGHYVASDFYRAYTGGGIFLLDELELGNGNLLGSLNGALANGKASFPNGIQDKHPDFVCIATGNTPALGATPAYSDRRALDGAVRDRFAFIEWNTDESFERHLALAQNPNADKWVSWIQSVRKVAATVSPRLIVTQRASVFGAKYLANDMDYATVADMLVFRGFDKASITSVLSKCPLPK
jgi:MoxR-like ATPase